MSQTNSLHWLYWKLESGQLKIIGTCSLFLRKLHDLSNNEAAPDSTRLVPTGLDTDFCCQSTTTSHTL
jgi:hypothetical protein